jgi:hypothetical protein
MELERNTEELDIKRVLEHYYSSGRYYNRSSQVNTNFDKEENMSGTFTLPVELTNALYGSVVEKIFDEFSGKKVGEEFSIEDVMKHFKVDGSYFEKKKESKKVEEKKEKKEKKVEEKKEKKKRKMSGYQYYQKKNKEEILEIWKNEKKTDKDIKFLTVASNLWKELGTEEQTKYNLEAKEM